MLYSESNRYLWILRRGRLQGLILSSACARTSVILAENEKVVVILIRVFARNVGVVAETSYEIRGFVILRPEEGLTSFNKANSANFSGGKKVK